MTIKLTNQTTVISVVIPCVCVCVWLYIILYAAEHPESANSPLRFGGRGGDGGREGELTVIGSEMLFKSKQRRLGGGKN